MQSSAEASQRRTALSRLCPYVEAHGAWELKQFEGSFRLQFLDSLLFALVIDLVTNFESDLT